MLESGAGSMSKDFDGSVIWVSGASGTLGRATAIHLAEEGAIVIASGRDPGRLPEHDGIFPFVLDITDAAATVAVANNVVERFGSIDGLVTSTTIPVFGDFLDLEDAAWLSVINTKLLGSLRPIRAVLPHFISRQEGRIVVLSGRGGIQPSPQHLPGSSVNAALNLLVQGLGVQYGPMGIRINAVSPGPIQSPRSDAMIAAGDGKVPETPIPGPGLPSDVADAVAFLLSERSRFITGTNLLVDGGGRRTA